MIRRNFLRALAASVAGLVVARKVEAGKIVGAPKGPWAAREFIAPIDTGYVCHLHGGPFDGQCRSFDFPHGVGVLMPTGRVVNGAFEEAEYRLANVVGRHGDYVFKGFA